MDVELLAKKFAWRDEKIESLENLLRQCLTTGAIRVAEHRPLYLAICKTLGQKPDDQLLP